MISRKILIGMLFGLGMGIPNLFSSTSTDSVFFTVGFKIGELTDSSVLIWTRLCSSEMPVPVYHEREAAPFRHPIDFDNDMPILQMDGAVPGSFGQIKIRLDTEKDSMVTGWSYVSSYQDYTKKQYFDNLKPNQSYVVTIWGRKESEGPVSAISGSFHTPPKPDQVASVRFAVSTCQYFWDFDDPDRGFRAYDSMAQLNPLFHCQTGDYIYYDKPGPMAYTIEQARHKWHAINSWPAIVDFHRRVPLYIQKDDHDLTKDDVSPKKSPFGELTFADGVSLWYEQAPVGEIPYRTFRWGKDLQIWLVEVREFRSDNWLPDEGDKTIWGPEQTKWFKETVAASDATFKVLVTPIPIVGPDRKKKSDSHANEAFAGEGAMLRKYLSEEGITVICGDRHWQYLSVDPNTGLKEFSVGPTSDEHAQGWKPSDRFPQHQFLKVAGGFLSVEVTRENGTPKMQIRHHAVDGQIRNEDTIH